MRFERIKKLALVLSSASLFLLLKTPATAEADAQSCKEMLSKPARMIYEKTFEKKAEMVGGRELWKEVARDLISDNRLAREEATGPALEAYECLKKENE